MAKTAGKNGIDIGDGFSVRKVGFDPNGNWSYWVTKGGNNPKKIQVNGNIDGPKITDITDFKNKDIGTRKSIKGIKDYYKKFVKEDTMKNIKEASVAARDGVVPDIAHAGTSFGLGAHRIDSDEVMSKINAIIGKYVDEEFVDPVAPVRVIRQHLSQLGVGFHFQQVAELAYDNEGEIGGVTIPLFQWGGRYGRLKDDSAEMFQDDGVSHRGKPLSIRFDWIQHENNSYSLAAKIIPS